MLGVIPEGLDWEEPWQVSQSPTSCLAIFPSEYTPAEMATTMPLGLLRGLDNRTACYFGDVQHYVARSSWQPEANS